LTVTPAAQGEPIEGHLEAVYEQARGTVAMGSSSVATRYSRLELEGTLGQTLRVRGQTTRLEDLQPAIAFAQGKAADALPLRLNNGSISIDGTVTGALDELNFRGQASVVNGQVRDFAFDRFAAEVAANRREISARGIAAARGTATVTGNAAIAFRGGERGAFTNSEVVAQLVLRNVDVAEVARETGLTEPVAGTASATVRVSGSLERPEVEAAVDVQNPRAVGESMERLRANVRYLPGKLELADGIANDAGSEVRFSGMFAHPLDTWRSGSVTFAASSPNLPSARIERLVAELPKVGGVLSGNVQGSGTLSSGTFTLTSASANASVRQIVVSGQNIGDITVQAATRDKNLTVSARGNVREAQLEADGAWRLEGDSPGTATVKFSRVSIATLQDLVMLDRPSSPPTVEGFVEGDARIRVALEKPREFQAEVRLPVVQVNPKQNPADRFGLTAEDVILRNNQPVVLDVNIDQVTVRSGSFTGRDSRMELAGSVPLRSDAGANLTVQGNINLIILQLLRPDLQATGNAAVNVSIRGSLQNPNVNGQLTLSNASLYLADLPSGIDHASGTIRFDRNSATIQNVTAEVGGGQIQLGGTLGFGDRLVYGIDAQARRIRVRYPQNVSTTFNADLKLTGNSEASRLTGTVNLVRSAFAFNTDLGQLLTGGSDPAPTLGLENEYLRGMQLDVRIQNGSDYQIQTTDSSLASNLEADVTLRLLGTPTRPALNGLITINRGEVQLNGNKFTMDRGDIRFLNRVKIEPTFDLELSTRARGVTVNVSLTGTMQQLRPNFSSDPPLQTSEIVDLLTIGRDPTSTTAQLAPGASSAGASSLFMQASGNLLGQAVSAQVSNTMQRFFGSTRVKIDPTLTGVDNLPQARVTWEQQVSKDITLTYITNLNRTQEQVVRFQWDMSRNLSAIAVRDANGLFGIDLQLRKRW
jgi:translocation and assembly module TamB